MRLQETGFLSSWLVYVLVQFLIDIGLLFLRSQFFSGEFFKYSKSS